MSNPEAMHCKAILRAWALKIGFWVALLNILTVPMQPLHATAPATSTVKLTVVITGMPNDDGHVLLALCASKPEYEGKNRPLLSRKLPIRKGRAEHTFTRLLPGDYAAKAYHDENSNGKLDKSRFLKRPQEAYGFSNNPDSLFGKPDWEKTRFRISDGEQQIQIHVK